MFTYTNRAELTQQLRTALITTSACFNISGPGNFGKSNLLRSLAQSSAPSPPANLFLVYIDFNLRADNSAQAFYELILREILTTQKISSPKLTALYAELSSSTATNFSIARSFLNSLDEILASCPGKLVLLLDEFDQPLQNQPDLVFLQLRALHDKYPDRLVYVTATNSPLLASGRDEQEGVGEFYELFEAAHHLHLQSLSQAESDQLACQLNPTLTSTELACIYNLSGGQPVLTRLTSQKLVYAKQAQVGIEQTTDWEQNLRLDPEIQRECGRIWVSLHSSEQQALLQHLEGIKTLSNGTLFGTLAARGLVKPDPADDSQSIIFARLFEYFVREKLQATPTTLPTTMVSQPDAPALAFDPHREEVIFGNQQPNLRLIGNSALLFKYLFMRQSEPYCSKDELITAIWGNGGYSSENLDRLVSDLRQDIGDLDKQIIRTIPRRGLQMVGVKDWKNQSLSK